MKALLLAAALLIAVPLAPVAAASVETEPALDLAPDCGPFVGVRCADGGEFCWVYVLGVCAP
ncbi:MAG TPA: hypothetical protein VHH36_01360 [Candidatus Thermoplasmatota archaeon]|nr:hypothetical protein [Candidatus Thermoplasmatota archaeon]